MVESALIATWDPSGSAVVTAADGRRLITACADENGFSPVELLCAAIGSCLIASLAPVLARHDAETGALHVAVTSDDTMLTGGLTVGIALPFCSDDLRLRCERAVANCPVLRALNIPVDIHWQTN